MFENLKAQIELMLDEIAQNPQDAHALQEALREKLAEMKALGMPLPADLVRLEHYLDDDLAAAHIRRRGQRSSGEPDAGGAGPGDPKATDAPSGTGPGDA